MILSTQFLTLEYFPTNSSVDTKYGIKPIRIAGSTNNSSQLQSSGIGDNSKYKAIEHNDKLYEKNRAAAAAKRYRAKFKNQYNDLKSKNANLESENERLKSELRAVKAILLAHRDCSVSRAMAIGTLYANKTYFELFEFVV